MGGTKEKDFLTVAPFECAWLKDLKFREAGRGCVAFEALAHNDVTLVFRENVGSRHYRYTIDSSPHYTVILGSHRNRRLKIEVDGKTVVDIAGVGLCCSSAFQSYWISIYDGLISVGKGKYPFQNLVFQWLDSNPHCNVQYVGLCSWDKHVGYRNVNVLPMTQNHISLWNHVNGGKYNGEEVGNGGFVELMDYGKWGLEYFLESWELSDITFIVGVEERPVPAHKAVLAAAGNFPLSLSSDVVSLPSVTYSIVHSVLQYIYTGQTKISISELGCLRDLSIQFEVMPLAKQCGDILEQIRFNKKTYNSDENVELSYCSIQPHCSTTLPFGLPLNIRRLRQLQLTHEYSDVNVYIEGHGLIAQPHKIILSFWSVPFAKMFTNGMSESMSTEISLHVAPEAFKAMLDFMYGGELNMEVNPDSGTLLLQLFLLGDQFGVTLLHQECCKALLECLSEDSVCPILQVVSSIPSSRLIIEACQRKFAQQFDYCTTASSNFLFLDERDFGNIIQHPDLTVTSEEKVLNAILMFCLNAEELCGWEVVDNLMMNSSPELLFGERLQSLNELLPCVRFPLLPYTLLKKSENCCISRHIPVFNFLVNEAITFIEHGLQMPENAENIRFQHRKSSYKELQYIRDGDSNGVLYFAGTSYGEHPWVNPVLAKRITIMASSPHSRHTDPKVLVSRAYQGTSYAGPQMENGQNCAWWMVDLGQGHQLMCNYYTLRQDGSMAYMRCWNLQGSLDGKRWTNLRVHENDQTIGKPGQFASWPVIEPNSLLPFRFFRVILTAPTVDASQPWNLCICYWELYGFFL